jgi:hypothetical protein
MTFIFFFRGGHKGWSILYHPFVISKFRNFISKFQNFEIFEFQNKFYETAKFRKFRENFIFDQLPLP